MLIQQNNDDDGLAAGQKMQKIRQGVGAYGHRGNAVIQAQRMPAQQTANGISIRSAVANGYNFFFGC
jgi:hypothetical protein